MVYWVRVTHYSLPVEQPQPRGGRIVWVTLCDHDVYSVRIQVGSGQVHTIAHLAAGQESAVAEGAAAALPGRVRLRLLLRP